MDRSSSSRSKLELAGSMDNVLRGVRGCELMAGSAWGIGSLGIIIDRMPTATRIWFHLAVVYDSSQCSTTCEAKRGNSRSWKEPGKPAYCLMLL